MKPLIYRIITRNASKWMDAGIDLGTQVTFLESNGKWVSNYGYKRGECPKCERLVYVILTVPTHYGVRKKDLNRIANIINE
jgi:hypothetical protein